MEESLRGASQDRVDGNPALTVRFWGVRGSVACCGPEFQRYGGNTCCVEVRCGSHMIILDAGTGLRALGEEIMRTERPESIDVFLSHTHYDHVEGMPFFAPLYCSDTTLRVWLGREDGGMTLESTLVRLMEAPFFPVDPATFKAQKELRDFRPGESLPVSKDFEVRTVPLRHPGGATGYRVDCCGRSVCYMTDTEHEPGLIDPALVAFAGGSDLMIYDSAYTEEEFAARIGWGHSTWEHGLTLAEAAGVGRLAAFHHDPSHNDLVLDRLENALQARHQGSFFSRDGLVVTLP